MNWPTSAAVSVNWLGEHLGTPGLVIVDCRFSLADPGLGETQYRQDHIPGAYYLHLNRDLSSSVQQHGGRHPLPNRETLATKLNQLGITSDSFVVVYDDSRQAFASRCWWLLRWLGHAQVAVLDGGYQAYRQASLPITSEVPGLKTGNFRPHPQAEWIVDYEAVKNWDNTPDRVLIDAREPGRYRGEFEPIDPIAGHIPGAVNYPWQEITTAEGRLKSLTELQAHWQNLGSPSEIVVYCGSGVTACVNLLGLELAGRPGAKLYAGSWSDWCSYQVPPGP